MSQDSKSLSSSETDVSKGGSPEDRIRKAVLLKDHAISTGVTVSQPILELLNEAECAEKKREFLCAKGVKLDQAIGELTNFTYPTTGETLFALDDPKQRKKIEDFKKSLPWWLLGAGVGFGAGYILLQMKPPHLAWGNILLATSLGLLGSVMFQIFNTIGVIKEKAFSIEDIFSNRLRIYIGPAIGFLFYFALTQGALPQGEKLSNGLAILLPFLGGFSTKLVVGILDKMVQAVMLAFGIEDKRADILVRQRRNQATAGTVPPGGEQVGKGDVTSATQSAAKTAQENENQPPDEPNKNTSDFELDDEGEESPIKQSDNANETTRTSASDEQASSSE